MSILAENYRSRLRRAYALLLVLTLIFTLYEELHLRRWLFQHYGGSSFLAGSLPNFLSELIFSFAIATLRLPITPRDTLGAVLPPVIGLSLYEVAQIWMPDRVFDWADLAATLIGAVIAWLLLTAAHKALSDA